LLQKKGKNRGVEKEGKRGPRRQKKDNHNGTSPKEKTWFTSPQKEGEVSTKPLGGGKMKGKNVVGTLIKTKKKGGKGLGRLKENPSGKKKYKQVVCQHQMEVPPCDDVGMRKLGKCKGKKILQHYWKRSADSR